MTAHRKILIALDSVGIDPLGHNRPDSVYSESRFLFPKDATGAVLPLTASPQPGILVETDVTDGAEQGAIECAITYTSIFSGQSASREHGLMSGLGLKDRLLELVSHTGRIELAREVFTVIERFVEAVLAGVDLAETSVVVTSDHGHLEQLGSSRGHPKSKVPTWYFGDEPGGYAARLSRPEGIFQVLTSP